jgi:glucose-1-phosphate thymidylyltransferase
MEAIVLAAGFATRLYPLTLNRAKPLLDVAGKAAIDHIMERLFELKEQGLSRVVVVSNSRFAADFQKHFGGAQPVEVQVVDNGAMSTADKLGAIGDMALGASYVAPGEDFFVLAGDNLFDFSLGPMAERFGAVGGHPVVLLYSAVDLEEVKLYNNLELDEDGRILDFVEKPSTPRSLHFATCIYLFSAGVRDALQGYLDQGLDPDKAGNFIKWLAKKQEVFTLDAEGRWFDVGSVAELEEAAAYFRTYTK